MLSLPDEMVIYICETTINLNLVYPHHLILIPDVEKTGITKYLLDVYSLYKSCTRFKFLSSKSYEFIWPYPFHFPEVITFNFAGRPHGPRYAQDIIKFRKRIYIDGKLRWKIHYDGYICVYLPGKTCNAVDIRYVEKFIPEIKNVLKRMADLDIDRVNRSWISRIYSANTPKIPSISGLSMSWE